MVEAQNTIVDGRHIRIEQARVNRTLFIHRFSRGTTEQVQDYVRAGGGFADCCVRYTNAHTKISSPQILLWCHHARI